MNPNTQTTLTFPSRKVPKKAAAGVIAGRAGFLAALAVAALLAFALAPAAKAGTGPASPRADVEPTRLNTSVPMVTVDQAREIVGILDDAMSASDASREEVVRHYFGDTTPGASMQRFLAACSAIVEQREAALLARGAVAGDPESAGVRPQPPGRE